MATLSPAPAGRRDPDRLFFTGMSLYVVLVVFAGFAPTYYLAEWLPTPARAPEMTALLHVHAAAFTSWIALGVLQPALIAAGRPAVHRRLGLFGAALAASVWALGNVVSLKAIHFGYKGLGDPYAFYAITFFSMQAFGVIVLLGILKRGIAQTHKRLMLLSSAAILEAAVGRLPFQFVIEAAPISFYVGADAIILAGALYDKLATGAVHKVWIWGGGALIASQFLRMAVMHSGPWLGFAHAIAAYA